MRTSLIISTYEWPAALDLTLRSVARQRRLPAEVIVADDGSGPATAAVVADWAARLPVPVRHVWQADRGYRLARSRNRAIAVAGGDYVISVDGDLVLHPSFVADHEAAARRGSFVQGRRVYTGPATAAGMLAEQRLDCPLLAPDLRHRHRLLRLPPLAWLYRQRRHRRARFVQGCNQGFWRDDLLRANGFDERMVAWGREDDELAARLFHAGLTRIDLRFAGVAIHLWHPARGDARRTANDDFLAGTRATRRTRCEHGIDGHAGATTEAGDRVTPG